MKRADDYEKRRVNLKELSDREIYDRFWGLAGRIVEPMLDMGYRYTTPAIERSILLRMGFSSVEIKPIIEGVINKGLMGKGCGNIVWRLAERKCISVREAGLSLADGRYWEEIEALFR